MLINLLFIYVTFLTQSLSLNSERLHFKAPKPHLVHQNNLYLIDLTSRFAFQVNLAKNVSIGIYIAITFLRRKLKPKESA